jgi:hypothetical protein
MWQVQWPDGRLSDMTNLARAEDAAACFMETVERRQRGRQSPSEGRLCVKNRIGTGRQRFKMNPEGKRPGTRMSENAAEVSEPCDPSKLSQGFFAVDRGSFRCAAVGGLNSAIAHLVMARGTGRDNRTTQWSVHAIEQRTSISRPNAAKGVKDLIDRGIWRKTREGRHPIYEAVPGNEIPGGAFTADEQAAIAAIRDGKAMSYELKAAAEGLAARGIMKQTTSWTTPRSPH